MASTGEAPGCFGKLPAFGDFVRGDAHVPELAQLDAWVEPGLYRAQRQLGDGFAARWQQLPPLRFVFCPDGAERALTGWLIASRDAAGRRYPLLLAVRQARGDVRSLPLRSSAFAAAARRCVEGGFPGLDPVGVTAAVHALPGLTDGSHQRAFADAPSAAAWQGCPAPAAVLHELAAATANAAPPRYALRWPSRGDDVDAAFWLEVVMQLGGRCPRLLLWHAAVDRAPGAMRLSLGPLEPSTFPGMVFHELDDDGAYDLGRATNGSEIVAAQRFDAVARTANQAEALRALSAGSRR